MKRHIARMHQQQENAIVAETQNDEIEHTHHDQAIPSAVVKSSKNMTLESVLGDVGLGHLENKFSNEGIDLELLLNLNLDDLRRMMQDLGINWRDKYKVEKQVEKKKQNPIVENAPHDETTTVVLLESMEGEGNFTLEESIVSHENILQISDTNITENMLKVPCELCSKAAKQKNPQHKCRKCHKVVCSILCSVPDPESDNEMHRIHKHGDDCCISEYSSSQDLKFDCPKCDKEFSCNTQLQSHISQKHEGFELSFPTMSLASEGSISDIYETCQQCGKIFENELDLANHVERVHEYGETFEIYPCEECGFRGTDIKSIRIHIANSHENTSSASESLEDLGIVKLPVVTKRRKQNLET